MTNGNISKLSIYSEPSRLGRSKIYNKTIDVIEEEKT